MRIRIPGALLITVRTNPAGPEVCALTLPEGASLPGLSRFTGGAADQTPYSKEFTNLANMVGQAFESSPLRNKNHRTKDGQAIRLEPYQKVGIAFGLVKRGRAGLFDPMGLGKTVQAIGLALTCPEKYLPLMVFCPRNAIGAWKKQLGYLAEGHKEADRIAAQGSAWVEPGALKVTVITTDLELHNEARRNRTDRNYALIIQKDLLTGASGTQDEDLNTIAARLSGGGGAPHGLLIVDEGHYYKNPNSPAFVRLYRLARVVPHVLVLTGTPAMISVTDTLPLMALIDPTGSVIEELGAFAGGNIQQSRRVVPSGQIVLPPEAGGGTIDRIGGTKDDPNDPGGSNVPWLALQDSWIERHGGAGSAVKVPEASGQSRDFDNYASGVANRVQDEFRQLAVRRARKSVKTLGGAEHLGIREKQRKLELVSGGTGALASANEDRAPFLERAVKMRDIDLMALQVALGQMHQGLTDEEIVAIVTQDPSWAPWRNDFESRTRRLKAPIGAAQKIPMGKAVITSAVQRFEAANYVPIIYFTYHEEVASALIKALWKAYHGKVNGFRLFIYGDKEGEVTGADDSRIKVGRVDGEADKTTLERIAANFGADDFQKPNVLVMSFKGKEGVDLPGGVEVAFVERFISPGEEEQAEDRINRANRSPKAPPPQIRYFMPDHFSAFALLNRLERRRASAQRTYGEDAESDYSTNLALGDDPNPMSPSDYIRRSFMAEADLPRYVATRLAWARNLPRQNPRRRNSALTATYLLSELSDLRSVRVDLGLPEVERPPGDRPPPRPSVPCTSQYTEAMLAAMVARSERFGMPLMAVAIGRTPSSPPCAPHIQRVFWPAVGRAVGDSGQLEPILAGFKDRERTRPVGVFLRDLHNVKLASPFSDAAAQANGVAVLQEAHSKWNLNRVGGRQMPTETRASVLKSYDTAYGYVTFTREVQLDENQPPVLEQVFGRPLPTSGSKFELRENRMLELDRAETHVTDEATGRTSIRYRGVMQVDPLTIVSAIEHVAPHPSAFKDLRFNGRRTPRLDLQAKLPNRGDQLVLSKPGTDETDTVTLPSDSFRILGVGHPEHPLEWSRENGTLKMTGGGVIARSYPFMTYPVRRVWKYYEQHRVPAAPAAAAPAAQPGRGPFGPSAPTAPAAPSAQAEARASSGVGRNWTPFSRQNVAPGLLFRAIYNPTGQMIEGIVQTYTEYNNAVVLTLPDGRVKQVELVDTRRSSAELKRR